MINNITILKTETLDPWWNLAVEEYLLNNVADNQCILYLWQNQNTVVIGRNQNPWRECRRELLEKEGGFLARRLSGGGAVFHDTGNLNFTFLMKKTDYDLKKQVSVILLAVKKLGIEAEMSGRNDLTVDGHKFSGNAFCFRKHNAYHHGTILVSADFNKLAKYLQVSEEKMKSKGIESVQARVINLNQLRPEMTINDMVIALTEAFKEIYGGVLLPSEGVENMNQDILKQLYNKYSSWEWRYGEVPKFDIELNTRFPWGGLELGVKLESGRIVDVTAYSDAMDAEIIEKLPIALKGVLFNSIDIYDAIIKIPYENSDSGILMDIGKWIKEKEF